MVKKLHCTHCGARVYDDESVPGQVRHPEPFDYSMGRPDTLMMNPIKAWWIARQYRRRG
jgi:hypothetical protein